MRCGIPARSPRPKASRASRRRFICLAAELPIGWISLYQYEGGKWILLPDVASSRAARDAQRAQSAANHSTQLWPRRSTQDPASRPDHGAHPRRLEGSEHLRNENRYSRHGSTNWMPPTCLYSRNTRRSDAPSVRFTAERVAGTLTGQPNIPLWIDAARRAIQHFRIRQWRNNSSPATTVTGFKSKDS